MIQIPANLILYIQNKTISLIAVCEHEYSYALPDRIGANPYDPYDTMEDIRMVRKSSDYVIVIYHGGKEHCRYPSPRLRKLCRAMVQNGADVILCQHSHCIGCYEKYEGSHILYGQGNFHFVTDSPYEGWYSGLIVVLDIEHALNVSFLPVVINPESCFPSLKKGTKSCNPTYGLANGSNFVKVFGNHICLRLPKPMSIMLRNATISILGIILIVKRIPMYGRHYVRHGIRQMKDSYIKAIKHFIANKLRESRNQITKIIVRIISRLRFMVIALIR